MLVWWIEHQIERLHVELALDVAQIDQKTERPWSCP